MLAVCSPSRSLTSLNVNRLICPLFSQWTWGSKEIMGECENIWKSWRMMLTNFKTNSFRLLRGLMCQALCFAGLVPWNKALAPPPQPKPARWVLLFAPFPRWCYQSLERLKAVLGARGSKALRRSRLPSAHVFATDPRPWVSLIKNKHHSELHFQGNICYFIGKSWYSHIYSFIQQLGNLWNTKENKNAPMSYRVQRGQFHLLYPTCPMPPRAVLRENSNKTRNNPTTSQWLWECPYIQEEQKL